MKEIQKEENAGALFVLPSQLNGAEYTSHEPLDKAFFMHFKGRFSHSMIFYVILNQP